MSYAIAGFGQEETACPPGASWVGDGCVCDSFDSIIVNGQCRDKSVACGPGTQWVDADNACVSLQKYMAPSQIEAAIKAGINLTGAPVTPKPAVVVRAASPVPKAPSAFATLASMFSGPNALWIVGGLGVGVLALTLVSKKKRR